MPDEVLQETLRNILDGTFASIGVKNGSNFNSSSKISSFFNFLYGIFSYEYIKVVRYVRERENL